MSPFLAAPARVVRLVLQGAVGLSAIAGGTLLVVATAIGWQPDGLVLPRGTLAGTAFGSVLVPGLILAVVVGGTHVAAVATTLVRARWALLTACVAAFGLLVWIFVQMVLIPYSPLQAVYEGAAVLELALVLVELGVLDVLRPATTRAAHGRAA